MKSLFIILFLLTSTIVSTAQKDISNSRADRKTMAFDKIDYTVQQYLIDEIKENTKCCGESSMIIRVEIDHSGKVTGVKPADGDNHCYQIAIMDNVRKIKWNTVETQESEIIEFEIKLDIQCIDGSNKLHETSQ